MAQVSSTISPFFGSSGPAAATDEGSSIDGAPSPTGQQYGEFAGKSSSAATSFNFVNSIVGAGIIGIPVAIKECGLFMGIILLFFVAYLVDQSVIMLVECGILANKINLEELSKHLFGRKGYDITLVFMFLYAYGAMVSYMVIIGDSVPTALNYFMGDEAPSRAVVIILSATIVVLPLSLLRDMSSLSSTSLLSLIADFIMIIFVCVNGPSSARNQDTAFESPADATFITSKVFLGIGTLSFAFVCQHNTFIVYRSMKEPSLKNWSTVAHYSLCIAAVMCLALGLGGYLSFGDNVEGDILNNFSDNDKLILGARLLLAITMVFTFPMECFVARYALLTFYHSYCNPAIEIKDNSNGLDGDAVPGAGDVELSPYVATSSSSPPSSPKGVVDNVAVGASHRQPPAEDTPLEVSYKTHCLVTLALWSSAVFIAIVFSDLSIVLALTGALAASMLGYIMPASLYFKTYEAEFRQVVSSFNPNGESYEPMFQARINSISRFIFPFLMLVFGIISMLVGVGSVIYEMATM